MNAKTATLPLALVLSLPVLGQSSTSVGFDGGNDEGFIGNAFFESTGGNPGGKARHLVVNFFTSLRTGGIGEPLNPAFVGDYSASGPVTFSLDVRVDVLTSTTGLPIQRPLGIALIDRDIQGPSGPSGVFFTLGVLSSSVQSNWTTLAVTIDDPTSTTLPPGWVGFGDEDPNTFEPILPAGASFATVLAGVDSFEITGAVPGFFFGFANFDVRIDNVAVELCEAGSSNYCLAATHSGGGMASMGDSGSPSVSGNNYAISVADAPANRSGLFYFGPNQVQVAFGDGFRCVGGMATRLVPPQMTDALGAAQRALDLTGFPQITPGSNWNFQFWFRDPGGPGGTGFNTSDGLNVTFCN